MAFVIELFGGPQDGNVYEVDTLVEVSAGEPSNVKDGSECLRVGPDAAGLPYTWRPRLVKGQPVLTRRKCVAYDFSGHSA